MMVRPKTLVERWSIPTLAAFFAIYVIWGTTFFAIRIAVADVPPLFAAAVRFIPAGLILYSWARLRGAPKPTAAQWRNLCLLGGLMFFLTYSSLFWAEKYVPSGIASVLVALLPIETMLIEIFLLKQERLRWPMLAAMALGFCGVFVITVPTSASGVKPLSALVIILGDMCWGLGAVMTRRWSIPESKLVVAGAEMLTGGLMLLAGSIAVGELHSPLVISPAAGLAIAYLTVFGSLAGFTAFVWLLGRMPATYVSSHAYVNPVVALIIGYFLGGEILSPNTLLGATLVILSVVLLFISRRQSTAR